MSANVSSVRFPRYEFLALFLPIGVVVLAVGYAFAQERTDARIAELLDRDGARLHMLSGFVAAEVSRSLHNLRALAAEPETRDAINRGDARDLRALEQTFLTLATRDPHYQQVRWIDQTGHERVRVTRDDGAPRIEPAAALQDKSARPYVQVARKLLAGEAYVSRLDLNVEHGRIEVPARPVIRIATPLEDARRKRRGVLVINIAMRYLFDLIGTPATGPGDTGSYLAMNQEGRVLNPAGGIPTPDAPTFGAQNPRVWAQIAVSPSGSMETAAGLWTWKTLSPFETFSRLGKSFPAHFKAFDQLIADEFAITLAAHRPVSALLDIRSDVRLLVSMGVLMTLSVYGFSLYLYLNGHVRARRAEIGAAYAGAQAKNMARLKELEERFRHLVEASSIGQMVVDADGRIEIANPAAERMLGYAEGELQGATIDSLVPEDLRVQHAGHRADYGRSPEARRMGAGRRLEARCKDGARLSVEVGLNPYLDKGRQLVLVSIIQPAG